MNKMHVGLKTELRIIKEKDKDDKITYVSEYYNGKKDGGYEESEVHITKYKDGSISLSDYHRDGWVNLYPEQVKHLKKILKEKL